MASHFSLGAGFAETFAMSAVGILLEVVVGSAVRQLMGWKRRTANVRRVPQPVWWRRTAAASLVGQQVPFVAGSVWLVGAAFRMGQDSFLFFFGLVLLVVAAVAVALSLVLALWGWTCAVRVLDQHGHARWFVGGFGLFGGLVVVNMAFVVGFPTNPWVLLFDAATATNIVLWLLASSPPFESPPSNALPKRGRAVADVLPEVEL